MKSRIRRARPGPAGSAAAAELKRSRYVWLKNDANLTVKRREKLTWLTRPSMQLKTTRAARWRDDFNGFYDQPTPAEAQAYLRRWCYGAKRSRLEPIKEFVKTGEAHWDGIIAWQQSRLSNGLLEGTNSLIQAAKRRARGYRNKAKMITIRVQRVHDRGSSPSRLRRQTPAVVMPETPRKAIAQLRS